MLAKTLMAPSGELAKAISGAGSASNWVLLLPFVVRKPIMLRSSFASFG